MKGTWLGSVNGEESRMCLPRVGESVGTTKTTIWPEIRTCKVKKKKTVNVQLKLGWYESKILS